MKIARNFLAALMLVVVAVACDANPTAPSETFESPALGSGSGE